MAKTMTPSGREVKDMTVGQIDKAVANYRALLEKHAPQLDSGAVQTVLGQPELADEQFSIFRRRAEAISGMIVRRVKVNRAITPQEAIDATNRKQYTDRKVVDTMPRGIGDESDVVFFKPAPEEYTNPRWMSDDDWEKALALRNLISAPPDDVAAVNEAEPAFADEKPHGTHWKDADGNWCYVTFDRWEDEREVNVFRNDDDWLDHWWFAGVRKSPVLSGAVNS